MCEIVVPWNGLKLLAGDGASLLDALHSTVLAVISGLATAQIVLWAFDLPGRDYWHRYRVVVASFCLGGAIMGELLGWLWILGRDDGRRHIRGRPRARRPRRARHVRVGPGDGRRGGRVRARGRVG